MEEEAADELGGFEAHELLAVAAPGTSLGAVVLPAEGDGVGIGRDEPAVGDGEPVGVAAEIGEYYQRSLISTLPPSRCRVSGCAQARRINKGPYRESGLVLVP